VNRWWTDPEKSRWALGLVGDTDVSMGVGTAVLAYHGLALEHLRPLAESTLVDGGELISRLDRVDLTPVATAVAKAVAPVMGEASASYGHMWAQDLHDRSLGTSVDLFTSLTRSGMAFPHAIDRVIAVHGIPSERLGPVAKHLREPRVTPRVLDDYADRALMEYAAYRGKLESSDVTISKSGAFQEREHPRDSSGKFSDKPSASGGKTPDKAFEDRQDRRGRRLRRMKRLVVQQNQIEQAQREAEKLKASAGQKMKQVVAPVKPKLKQRPVNALMTGSPFGDAIRRQAMGMQQARRQAVNEGIIVEEIPFEHTPASDEEVYEQLTSQRSQRLPEHSMLGERFYILTNDEFEMLASSGVDEWSAAGFKALTGNGLYGYTAQDALADLQSQVNDNLASADDFVILRADGRIPLNFGESLHEDEGSGQIIPDSAMLSLGDELNFFDYDDRFHLEQYTNNPSWGEKGLRPVRVVDIQLVNQKMFPLTKQDKVTPLRRYSPSDVDEDGYPGISKADAFLEREHPRDSEGRFKDKDVQPKPPVNQAFLDRQDRRRRRMNRQVKVLAQLEQIQHMRDVQAAQEAQAREAESRQAARKLSALKPQAMERPKNALAARDAVMQRMRALGAAQVADVPEGAWESLGALTFDSEDFWTFYEITGGDVVGNKVDDSFDMTSMASIMSDHDDTELLANKNVTSASDSLNRILRIAQVSDNRITKVINPVNGRNALLSLEEAEAVAEKAAMLLESKDDRGSLQLPFLEYVSEGSNKDNPVMRARVLTYPNEPAGYQILGDPQALAALQRGDRHLLDFEDQSVIGARDLAVRTGNLDESGIGLEEIPDLPIGVVLVKMKDNASQRRKSEL